MFRPVLLLFLSAILPPTAVSSPPLRVFVTLPPQAYFVERLGGDQVVVDVLLAPGRSHHTYEPTPQDLVRLSKSEVYFRIGAPFENALATKLAFTLDEIEIVNTQDQVELVQVSESDGEGKPDPHFWLDPVRMKSVAQVMAETLIRLRPESAVVFRENLRVLELDLETLDQNLETKLAPYRGQSVYVFHPAYGYLLNRYGLKQVAIERDGKEPGPRDLAFILDQMKANQVRVLFVQPQFSPRTAKTLSESLDLAVVTLDPLARDYIANLESIGESIRAAFTEKPPLTAQVNPGKE